MNPDLANLSVTDEDALLRRVQAGDLAAFEPLVDQHLPAIRAFLALRTPAAHLVDELAHETFVFAFQRIHEFERGSSMAKWLRAIAWNLLRAEILRFSREAENVSRYALARQVDELARRGDPSESREVEFLGECLEALPAAMGELLTLKYHGEHTTEEIARRLKRSAAWVWTTLFRVRQQLKQCIERKLAKEQPC